MQIKAEFVDIFVFMNSELFLFKAFNVLLENVLKTVLKVKLNQINLSKNININGSQIQITILGSCLHAVCHHLTALRASNPKVRLLSLDINYALRSEAR